MSEEIASIGFTAFSDGTGKLSMRNKKEILEEAKERASAMSFGEPITNVCTSTSNPHHHSYFVEFKTSSRKNRYGITHNEYTVRCTDRCGRYWETGVKVIFPGHLANAECEELYAPIWESEFGDCGGIG